MADHHPIPEDSHYVEFFADEINSLHEEKKEVELQLKMKSELCKLLEEQNEVANELIGELEEALQIEKLTLSETQEKFKILKESGASPIEGVVHEEEDKSVSEKIFSASSWIEKQKLFQENITELSKEWKKLNQ